LKFAIFGDVHGRVALMITLARRWQEQTGHKLDGLLQVGDMGAFPDHRHLDDSTRRFARTDPDELGFKSFLTATEEATALLASPECPPITFCRGNHEDFAFLERFSEPTALDPWQKLWFIPDGCAMDRAGLRIGAFGGAAPLHAEARRGRRARAQRRKQHRRELAGGMGPRFGASDLELALRHPPGPVEILLTHAGPLHPSWRGGSADLVQLARAWQPRVHLFGHHHQQVGPIDTPHGLLIGFEHLEFLADGQLRPGSWGVLQLDEASVSFEWALRETHPWLVEMTRTRWRCYHGAGVRCES
jgi:hypothetical protein